MIDAIRGLLHAQPFVPFYVLTSGGNRYRVATVDHAGINPSGKQIIIWFDNEGGISLAGLHIVGVEKEGIEQGQAV